MKMPFDLHRVKRKHKIMAAAAVLFVCLVAVGLLAYFESRSSAQRMYAKTELNAVSYSNRLTEDLNSGVRVSDTLKQILISEGGELNGFETVAENLMTDCIYSIQLAPGGVISQSYPKDKQFAIGMDLLEDETRGKLTSYAKDYDIVVMQGPFELTEGENAIAVWNPVYLDDENGEEYFWGFTVCIMRVPDVFENSLNALDGFGYNFRLSKTTYPASRDFKVIYSSGEIDTSAASHTFDLGNCKWKLEVYPKKGWGQESSTSVILFFGCVIVVMLAALGAMLLVFDERRRRFKRMASTDALTGLLNRSGFDEEMNGYIAEHPHESCVGAILDIDAFKLINDVYGHHAGDEALKKLADSMRTIFPTNAILGRNGGDEFCILLKNRTIHEVETRIRQFTFMPHTFESNGETHHFTISLGYAEYPKNAETASKLIGHADMALYEVKLHGKNGCLAFSAETHPEKQRTQLGFGLKDIDQNLPGAFLIYIADKNDDRILFANAELVHFAGCSSLDEFMEYTNHSFRNLVHPDEYERVEKSIWEQIDSDQGDRNDYVRFRFMTKSGEAKPVLDHGRIVQNDYYGRVFYVLFMDCGLIEEHYHQEEE